MLTGFDKERLFGRILKENGGRLHLIVKTNSSQANSNDLRQEILLALWMSLDRYEGRSSLATWFYGVAINVVRSFSRRNQHWETATGSRSLQAPSTAYAGHNRSQVSILSEFIQSLDDPDRFVLQMYLDRLSYAEISEATGIAEANLRVRISRLKQQFTTRYIGCG